MSYLLAVSLTLLITSLSGGAARSQRVEEPRGTARVFLRARQSMAGRNAWEGTYSFLETGGRSNGESGPFVEHTIKVYRQGDELIADVDTAGFQTSVNLRCVAKARGNKIDRYFWSYRADNTFEPYRKGQLLLFLERADASGRPRLLTHCGAYQPALGASKSGRVYFRKIR